MNRIVRAAYYACFPNSPTNPIATTPAFAETNGTSNLGLRAYLQGTGKPVGVIDFELQSSDYSSVAKNAKVLRGYIGVTRR